MAIRGIISSVESGRAWDILLGTFRTLQQSQTIHAYDLKRTRAT